MEYEGEKEQNYEKDKMNLMKLNKKMEMKMKKNIMEIMVMNYRIIK